MGGGAETPLERQQRWGEWIREEFSVTPEQEIPKNMHISEQTRSNVQQDNAKQELQNIPEELKQIWSRSKLHILIKERPNIGEWLARPCAQDGINKTLKNL